MHCETKDNGIPINADISNAVENKISNKNPKINEPLRESAKSKIFQKTLRIGWLHRELSDRKYRRMKKPLGGVIKLKLDESSIYSAYHIKQMAIERFSDSLSDRYNVQLGLFNGQVISEFELPSGKPSDFWGYCRAHDTAPYQLNLFILTTPKDEFYVDRPVDRADAKLTRARRRTKIKNGEYVPRDDIQVRYHYMRLSKYSGEQSWTECRKCDLHAYFLDEQFGDGPTLEQFDPLDYGYSISRIEMDDRILLHIVIENDSTRCFNFPCNEVADGDSHVVLHDVDEIQGFCDGGFGLGFVTSCTCRGTIFKWYRNGQLFRSGESLYWLGNVTLEPGRKSNTFCCVVACKIAEVEIKSKEIVVTEEMIGKRLEYPY